MHAQLYQIYYNEASRQMLDAGFIALDNRANLRPDWYEFWVIKQFLETVPLQADTWYGFFSPKLGQKTGLGAAQVQQALQSLQGSAANVLLLGSDWDQNAYFLNPFEQGEFWHPGLLALSQQFFDALGWRLPLAQLVCHSQNFTFSNYIVAKPAYWRAWLALAQPFFDACEDAHSPWAAHTHYHGSATQLAPMKTFIQERFAAVLLQDPQFVCATLSNPRWRPINPLFAAHEHAAAVLQTCDLLKIKAGSAPEAAAAQAALAAYWQARQLLRLPGQA